MPKAEGVETQGCLQGADVCTTGAGARMGGERPVVVENGRWPVEAGQRGNGWRAGSGRFCGQLGGAGGVTCGNGRFRRGDNLARHKLYGRWPTIVADIHRKVEGNRAGVGDGDGIAAHFTHRHKLFDGRRAVNQLAILRRERQVGRGGLPLRDGCRRAVAEVAVGTGGHGVAAGLHGQRAVAAAAERHVKAAGAGDVDAGAERVTRARVGDGALQEAAGGAAQVHRQRHDGRGVDKGTAEVQFGRVLPGLVQRGGVKDHLEGGHAVGRDSAAAGIGRCPGASSAKVAVAAHHPVARQTKGVYGAPKAICWQGGWIARITGGISAYPGAPC